MDGGSGSARPDMCNCHHVQLFFKRLADYVDTFAFPSRLLGDWPLQINNVELIDAAKVHLALPRHDTTFEVTHSTTRSRQRKLIAVSQIHCCKIIHSSTNSSTAKFFCNFIRFAKLFSARTSPRFLIFSFNSSSGGRRQDLSRNTWHSFPIKCQDRLGNFLAAVPHVPRQVKRVCS